MLYIDMLYIDMLYIIPNSIPIQSLYLKWAMYLNSMTYITLNCCFYHKLSSKYILPSHNNEYIELTCRYQLPSLLNQYNANGNDAENNMDHNSSPNAIKTVNTKSLKQY